MISADLTGKTVLVTGGSSGIGLAAVELFARSGTCLIYSREPGMPRMRSYSLTSEFQSLYSSSDTGKLQGGVGRQDRSERQRSNSAPA